MAISDQASEQKKLLSIDSFSYGWLVNLSDSFRFSLDGGEAASPSSSASFIEMDPKLPPSKRFLRLSLQDLDLDFDFDFDLDLDLPCSLSDQPASTADVIFSNGMFNPKASVANCSKGASDRCDDGQNDDNDDKWGYEGGSNLKGCTSPTATPLRLMVELMGSRRIKCSTSLRRCGTLSKRVFRRYLEFLCPIYHILRRCRRGSIRSKVRSLDDQHIASSTSSSLYGRNNWRRSCDSESSIHEAVLHCKRSIGK